MTLTEQWKKGELEWHKSYYCQNRKGEVTKAICLGDSELHSEELGGTLNIGYWEVLAPVPSYEEWQELSKQRNQLIRDVKDLAYIQEENQQLKELLKECRERIYDDMSEDFEEGRMEFLTKIDNAIGEKNNGN